MQIISPPVQTGKNPTQSLPTGIVRLALNEHELALRWGISVKTIRRWRQSKNMGPVFCKMGARVTYLISDVEEFEQRVSRYSTSSRVLG